MRDSFRGFERGERKSAARHLPMIEYKAAREKGRVESLEAKSAKLGDEVRRKEDRLSSLASSVSGMENRLQSLRESVKDVSSIMAAARSELGAINAEADEKRGIISMLDSAAIERRGIILGLDSEIGKKSKSISMLDSAAKELEIEIGRLEGGKRGVQSLSESLAARISDQEKHIAANSLKISDQERRIADNAVTAGSLLQAMAKFRDIDGAAKKTPFGGKRILDEDEWRIISDMAKKGCLLGAERDGLSKRIKELESRLARYESLPLKEALMLSRLLAILRSEPSRIELFLEGLRAQERAKAQEKAAMDRERRRQPTPERGARGDIEL
jgi:chromosome segregation ATPase